MGRGAATIEPRGLLQRLRGHTKSGRLEELKALYPGNGTCPVLERTGDGTFVGRCDFGLRGSYCPRHGNLQGMLTVYWHGRWQGIPEKHIVDHEDRDFGPWPELDRLTADK